MKTAILLTGALRTWNQCQDHIVSLFSKLCDNNLDWYMVYWRTSTSSLDQIKEFFNSQNQNLQCLIQVDPNQNPYFQFKTFNNLNESLPNRVDENFYSPSYLRYLANQQKKIYELENNMVYDKVVFIRPDVMYYYNNFSYDNWNQINDRESLPFFIGGDLNTNFDLIQGPQTGDVYAITGSISSDIYALSHFSVNTYDSNLIKIPSYGSLHKFIARYLIDHNLGSNLEFSPICARVTRPTTNFELVSKLLPMWKGNFIGMEHYDFNLWQKILNYDLKKCLVFLDQLKIDPRDYNLSRTL